MSRDRNLKVLWIDDEYHNYGGVIEKFNENRIETVGFSNAEEALADLEDNHSRYDAIILDGLFYENIVDEKCGDARRQIALNKVLSKLAEKRNSWGAIPHFIYSGKAKIMNVGENDILESFKINKIYNKNNDESFEDLCSALRNSDKESLNIKLKYKSLFGILEERGFSSKAYQNIYKFLKNDICLINKSIDEEFTSLRKIIEELLIKYADYGVLHPDFINKKGLLNFSGARDFLSGKKNSGELSTKLLPLEHSYNAAYYIWNNTSDDLHFSKNNNYKSLNLDSEAYNEFLINKLSAVTHCIIDLIYEFDSFIKKHPDKEKNEAQWKTRQQENEVLFINEETEICQDEGNNYYCIVNGEKTILPYLQVNNIFAVGEKIIVNKTDRNKTNSTKNIYKRLVIDFTH